ncbi:MAG TPA: aldehyde dehydrogenase family protein [Polyangiaceae bacterium]|jgi:acyl-CoA reductase-like NAD-dependent aldehyde dehydrogenase|nr:aldehyde dehydrogenase family protein [Polyangiaceae bacterium]
MGASRDDGAGSFGQKPPPDSEFSALERALDTLSTRATAFARAPIADKAAWLREIAARFHELAPRMVKDACAAKGIAFGSQLEGEEWLAGLLPIIRNLTLLAATLDDVRRYGAARVDASRLERLASGALAVEVTPNAPYEALFYAPFRAQTWLEPGVDADRLGDAQASFYKRRDPEGRVALVLGAGNVASIPVLDVIYKSFVEGAVCLLKMSPVNAYLGPYFELALAPLIARGFLRIAYGGADVGAFLTRHPAIAEMHITGSTETHDRIVWGLPGPAREERKSRNAPLFEKPVTSELGNITPVLIAPGKYTDAELSTLARGIAGMVSQNASFNCIAAKLLITPRGFTRREALIARLEQEFRALAPRRAYYPGAEARFASLTEQAAHVTRIGSPAAGELPWALITELDPDAQAPQFSLEPFCSVLSEVSVGSSDPIEFFAAATQFANEHVWGTLNAMIYLPRASERDKTISGALDRAVLELRYGTVAINQWSAGAYVMTTSPWGGYPGSTLKDVQSGIGWVHNSLMLERVLKTVQRGPLRAFPTPPYFPRHRSLRELGRALFDFEAKPSALAFARVGYFAAVA